MTAAMAAALPFAVADGGIRLAVRLTPRASAERILGLAAEADGRVALKVAVTAPAEGGRANDALMVLIAKVLRLPRRNITLALGAADRRKLVHIAGDPTVLAHRLEEVLRPWLKQG